MKLAPLLINPADAEHAERVRAQIMRTIWIIIFAVLTSMVVVALVMLFLVELPIAAVLIVVAELAFAVYVYKAFPAMQALNHRAVLVPSSMLRGLTISQFATPQQLWDAAVCVRDTGDKARAQMILGS